MNNKEILVCFASTARRGLQPRLEADLTAAGIPWHHEQLHEDPNTAGNLGRKLALLRRLATGVGADYERLVICDAWDILFVGTRESLIAKVPTDRVVLAAERNCWPDGYLASVMPDGGTPWRYMNGGFMAGSPTAILSWCDEAEADPTYSPDFLDQQWLNHLLLRSSVALYVDHATELCYCMALEKRELQFKLDNLKLRPCNTLTQEYPEFIHFNGKWPTEPYFTMENQAKFYNHFYIKKSLETIRDLEWVGRKPLAERKPIKLAIASAIYNSQPCEDFMDSLIALMMALEQHHVPTVELKLPSSCYISWARNAYVTNFLETDCTHLLFLDSDMGFDTKDVLKMLAFADKDNLPVIGGAYRHKSFNWKKVKEAVVRNPAIDPRLLEYCGVKWTFFGLPDGEFDVDKPIEIQDFVPTGLMLISRDCLENMRDRLPLLQEGGRDTAVFFDARYHLDCQPQEFRGEDVYFCREWRRLGGKIYLAPWVRSTHVGPYRFKSDMRAVAAAGEEITIDEHGN